MTDPDFKLQPGERLCDLGRHGLQMIQRLGDGCFSQDSVLLADFAWVRPGDRVCDLGAGDGALSLLLLAREPSIFCEMVEIREELCRRAERSALLNGISSSVKVRCADAARAPEYLKRGSFDLVVSNPPYYPETEDDMLPGRRLARQQASLNLEALAGSAAELLRHHGRFCLCYPAARMLQAADALRARDIEPKRMRLAAAYAERAPYLCLMEGMKGAKPGMELMPALIQFDSPGCWSKEMRGIYEEDGGRA